MAATSIQRLMPSDIRSAVVLGAGASGTAASRLLAARGVEVVVLDAGTGPLLEEKAGELRASGIAVRLGPGLLPPDRFDLCVPSPGVRIDDPWVTEARARGVRVWGELELGWRATGGRVLAVTGSNGKSTLAKLCHEALVKSGVTALLAGNYGTPLCEVAQLAATPEWLVVEVSSFQLETVDAFCPDAGILLNLNPNHLDRHGTMGAYARAKARLFARMGTAQTAVVPARGAPLPDGALPAGCGRRTFGLGEGADAVYSDGTVRLSRGVEYPLRGTLFANEVMGLTAAAAMAALDACGVDALHVCGAARVFERLPHRMEPVRTIGGVAFVDDSKATNLAALTAGLAMAGGPVRLIAGGLLKEHDLQAVKKSLVNRVRGVYIIGKCAPEMAAAWRDVVPCCICRDLSEAVQRAWKEASTGEVVLLSPGCASFDQFRSFEDRGDRFKSFVRGLKEE